MSRYQDFRGQWVNRSKGSPLQHTAQIHKLKEDEQLVWAWLYVSKTADGEIVVDHSGEVVDIEELEAAGLEYGLNHRVGKVMHDGEPIADLVQFFVSSKRNREAMGIPEGHLPDGLWGCWKVSCPEAWARIKSGELKEMSIGGLCLREAIDG